MLFRPDVHAELVINGMAYRVATHPQSLNYQNFSWTSISIQSVVIC